MKTAASWLRGALVGLFLVAPATGKPAENVSFAAQVEPVIPQNDPPVLAAVEEAVPPPPAPVDPFPGRTYGNLDDVSCLVLLEDRKIPYERYGRHARGVQTPVRLMGPLHGVRFMHADATDWLASARREILDCRLVLALDDLAALLADRGITTVLHYGVYRGDLPLPKTGRPLHHVAALAMDVAAFEKDDGTRLEVRRDWAASPRAHTCDADVAPDKNRKRRSERSDELRGILCDVVEQKLFHQVLTPNHDARHQDHFHLEVMRGTEWTLVE